MPVEEILVIARDWGILVLFVQWFILALLPLLILWKVTRALKRFLPRARTVMATLRAKVERVTQGVARVMAAVRRPFVWWSSVAQGVRTIAKRYQAKDL